jgi:hypothetical protein
MKDARSTELIRRMDAANARACDAQRELLSLIAEADACEAWREDGANDLAQWLWMRYGISEWKAHRWTQAAHALESLPLISRAFSSGALGIDKVVELTRFATPATEAELVSWARSVSAGRIRRRAEVLARRARQEAEEIERDRHLQYWYFDEGRRFGLEAELPAASGAVVAAALERLAEDIAVMPGEHPRWDRDARRADALVAMASARVGQDPDPDRATVVVHAPVEALVAEDGGCEIEGGGVIHSETARRLACEARVQVVVEDVKGEVTRLGRVRRDPPAWMVRQLRYRDGGCTFPGCGSRRFARAHHIEWWAGGGRTNLANLTLVCSFHHKLVHEYGWRITRTRSGVLRWFRPDGTRYRAGPGPPSAEAADELDPQDTLPLVAFRRRVPASAPKAAIRAGPAGAA